MNITKNCFRVLSKQQDISLKLKDSLYKYKYGYEQNRSYNASLNLKDINL